MPHPHILPSRDVRAPGIHVLREVRLLFAGDAGGILYVWDLVAAIAPRPCLLALQQAGQPEQTG